MAELTTAEKLSEARTALHKLMTGSKMVQVGYGDARVQYTAAEADQLRLYIAELEGLVDTTKARRPLSVRW